MNAGQARDLLYDLLRWRQVQAQPPAAPEPGHYIKSVTAIGESRLVITFADGTMARAEITAHPAPGGSQE